MKSNIFEDEEIKNNRKYFIKNSLIIIFYISLLLILENSEWNLNYSIALMYIMYYLFLIKNGNKFNEKEKSIFNKIFYSLVLIGVFCIIFI